MTLADFSTTLVEVPRVEGCFEHDSSNSRRENYGTGTTRGSKSSWTSVEARSEYMDDLAESVSPHRERPSSPTPSTSSSFSAATTSAAVSSRASLSCSRSSVNEPERSRSPRPYSRSACSSSRPEYSSRRRSSSRRERSRRYSRSDRYFGHDSEGWSSRRERRRSSYREAQDRPRSRGLKRNRSSSREPTKPAGVQCSRCLEFCRAGVKREPITRTLPVRQVTVQHVKPSLLSSRFLS